VVHGVVNGIDDAIWNPAPISPMMFSSGTRQSSKISSD
jgi:glycogen synthase